MEKPDKMVSKRFKVGLVIALVIAIASVSYFTFLRTDEEIEPAADFSILDTNGDIYNLSDFQGEKVVVLDFMSITCTYCPAVEDELMEIYEGGKFKESMVIISLTIYDTLEEVTEHKEDNGIPWIVSVASPEMQRDYALIGVPKLVIIDLDGYVTYEKDGLELQDDIDSGYVEEKIEDTIEGRASQIALVELSIYGMAIMGGIASFFSPCSFPMLPGFMSYYLRQQVTSKRKLTLKLGATSGAVAALGIIIVFFSIGILVQLMSETVTSRISYLNIIVGIMLVALGALMFTSIQYYRIIEPFRAISSRLRSKKGKEGGVDDHEEGGGYYIGLFSYGLGYGAAAAGCTLPFFLAILVMSFDLNLLKGIMVIVLYTGTMAIFMMAITAGITVFGQGAVQKLSNYTEVIKILTAGILISVGVFMVWAFFHDGNGPGYMVDFTRDYPYLQLPLHLIVWAITIWKTYKAYRIAFPEIS